MSLVTTKELMLDAQKNHYAIGAFNAENMEMVQAIIAAAEELRAPVIVQTTPGTLKYASPAILVKKGENRKSKRSYNTKGSDNLISNGSIIAVNEGQCMMIVDQGAIVEVCAEAGEFVYDTSA